MYGSLAHTGISWPIYLLVGMVAVLAGGTIKLYTRIRGDE